MKMVMPWGTLSAVDEGRGPVVVLLHSLAQSAELWRPLIDELSPSFRVIAPDARGHGSSTWDGNPFTVADLAEDVASLIGHLDAGPVSVVGMSMGGCTAIALASRHPELVDRLVLADTTADYGPDKAEAWETRASNASSKPREQQIEFQRDRWFSPAFVDAQPDEVQRVAEIFIKTDSEAHAAACRALGQFDDTDRLAKVVQPTLLLVGEDDYATPPDMAGALHQALPDSRLEILPQTRHLSLIENRRTWSMLRDHLQAGDSPDFGGASTR